MTIGSVKEGSTIIVTIGVADQNGNEQIPKTGTWTLLDRSGDIVNGRDAVVITPLSASMEVALTCDDLPSPTRPNDYVTFIFEGTYDTTVNGQAVTDQCLRDSDTITLEDIPEIP